MSDARRGQGYGGVAGPHAGAMTLRALAPAKVNLCLFLGGTRADGRHELVTLFESLSLADEVVLETQRGGADRVLCPGVEGENLALAAIAALRERGWQGPPVRITISKRIPVAAGMAGGSTDAAAALRLAAALEPVAPAELETVAASLGADVPSQLTPGVCLGTGAGELVAPCDPLDAHAFAILPSAEQLSTAAVYREADRLGLGRDAAGLRDRALRLQAALVRGGRLPQELIVNDLAPAALSLCPAISRARSDLVVAGADQAIVCGSGPTVAGVLWGADASRRAQVACRRLADDHPGALAVTPVESGFGAVRRG